MNHESKLAAALAEADGARDAATRKADAEHNAAKQKAADELGKAIDKCDRLTAEADAARQAALDAASAARAEALSIAARKFDDAMRSEMDVNVEIREQAGVLFLVDPKTQLTVASATPTHGQHTRIIGPRGDITIVPRDRARAALWQSAKPLPVPAPA